MLLRVLPMAHITGHASKNGNFWLGLRVGGHPALSLHSLNEPGELSQ